MLMSEIETPRARPAIPSNNDSAIPAPLRVMDLERTGNYLNDPALKRHISFKGEGDIDRSFTILVAIAKMEESYRVDLNGIAIIDNDNWAVLVDGCHAQATGVRGASAEQRAGLDAICSMGWAEFGEFIRSQERFRPAVARDITDALAVPLHGNADNQVRLGLRRADDIDLRSDFIKCLHESGCYDLPRATRRTMINEIMMHPNVKVRDGIRLSWSTSMTGFEWDTTGRVCGGEDLDPGFDGRWKSEMRRNPELLEQAIDRAFEVYLRSDFDILEMPEARCGFYCGNDAAGSILLDTFNGDDMKFADHREMRQRLTDMGDEKLSMLWTSVRVMDADLSRENRADAVAEYLNSIRSTFERGWAFEHEDDLSL